MKASDHTQNGESADYTCRDVCGGREEGEYVSELIRFESETRFFSYCSFSARSERQSKDTCLSTSREWRRSLRIKSFFENQEFIFIVFNSLSASYIFQKNILVFVGFLNLSTFSVCFVAENLNLSHKAFMISACLHTHKTVLLLLLLGPSQIVKRWTPFHFNISYSVVLHFFG